MNSQLIIETNKLSKIKTSHLLHLVMSLITVGFWVPVWVLVAISNSIEIKRAEKRIRDLTN